MITHLFITYFPNKSSWNFEIRFNKENFNLPILTCPTKESDWSEILSALTEYAVFLKLYAGSFFKIILTKEGAVEKTYSTAGIIMGGLLTGYAVAGYPLVMGKLVKTLNEVTKHGEIEPGLRNRILDYAKAKYTDCYFVNLGPGSCFINPQNLSKGSQNVLKKVADSERLRTIEDWILKGLKDKKSCIFYSDLDSPLAVCHEIGHHLIDRDGKFTRFLQRNGQKGFFSDEFASFVGFCIGLLGKGPSELKAVISYLNSLMLKQPQLVAEYLASYKGLQMLKNDIKVSDKTYQTAKKYYKTAFRTYLAGTNKDASVSAALSLGGAKYAKSHGRS